MIGFSATMPAVYARLYSVEEVAEHAAIVARRGNRLVHAEVWHSAQGPLLCVVADDQPGFMALVTDTLLAQGLTVRAARAFCRELGNERLEAIDFLELHELGAAADSADLDDETLGAFVQSLSELISDELAERAAQAPREPSPGEEPPPTRVYFEREPHAEGRYLLVVDAPDSDGLLYAICNALYAQNVRIMTGEVRTVAGRAQDRFEIEPIGRRLLKDHELCDVQLAVLDALPSRR